MDHIQVKQLNWNRVFINEFYIIRYMELVVKKRSSPQISDIHLEPL